MRGAIYASTQTCFTLQGNVRYLARSFLSRVCIRACGVYKASPLEPSSKYLLGGGGATCTACLVGFDSKIRVSAVALGF